MHADPHVVLSMQERMHQIMKGQLNGPAAAMSVGSRSAGHWLAMQLRALFPTVGNQPVSLSSQAEV